MGSAAEAMEWSTPFAKSGGVESALPICTAPSGPSTMVSVQVPPTSVAIR